MAFGLGWCRPRWASGSRACATAPRVLMATGWIARDRRARLRVRRVAACSAWTAAPRPATGARRNPDPSGRERPRPGCSLLALGVDRYLAAALCDHSLRQRQLTTFHDYCLRRRLVRGHAPLAAASAAASRCRTTTSISTRISTASSARQGAEPRRSAARRRSISAWAARRWSSRTTTRWPARWSSWRCSRRRRRTSAWACRTSATSSGWRGPTRGWRSWRRRGAPARLRWPLRLARPVAALTGI